MVIKQKLICFKIGIVVVCSLFFFNGFSQSATPFFFASKYCRDSVTEQLVKQIESTVSLPFTRDNYGKWAGSFWAMELMLYKPTNLYQKLPQHIQGITQTPVAFQRSFLEMLYTLYPQIFAKKVAAIWQRLGSDKAKAMALEYMATANYFPKIHINDAFRQSAYYPIYRQRWQQKQQPLTLTKNAFLNPNFLTGQTVLCSFQSNNRNVPGYLMMRTSNGKWLTDEVGKPLQFSQLARSITNLPFYLTNGNTPLGLYKINGLDTSTNNWIGPTTNLQLVLPFEDSATVFFGVDTAFAKAYKKLLQPLQNHLTLYQSFIAGQLGRSEIIAHGTTINPAYYHSQKYYPLTPSLGCLCSPEIWNNDGQLIKSVQQQWIDAVQKLQPQPIYLLVAEVKDL
jgi:hypothetical protein